MTNQHKPSKALHTTLWVVQILLAVMLLWAGTVKLFQPAHEVAAMWSWAGEVPLALLRLTGAVDLLGGLGLILPALLRIRPRLTPFAAVGIVVLMICAGIFHIVRGEGSQIGFNVLVAVLAAGIAWGRFGKAAIPARHP
ncbi:DoxX family protein [Fulvivirgaceae bacterium PWU5]|uniref:DoxX family protein n=1 Tax=Dawidia cretensis TaxID=2782350 RepID=A0AAP2DVY8_9BACT|nr:DoxX family protein [Dawidia cretensis]MBT1708376.1 DoxX family protein [Dawidia cretensis]